MITPWEIYWVLQLDSISNFLVGAFIAISVCLTVALVVGCIATDRGCYPSEQQDASWQAVKHLCVRLLVAGIVVGLASAFVPSTRTAAAMIVAPKIINSPTVQHEAGDLYKLAKQALENAVAPKPEKRP